RPQQIQGIACGSGGPSMPRSAGADVDSAGIAIVNERWRALGAGSVTVARSADISVHVALMPPQGYRMIVRGGAVRIEAADSDGVFYAMTTLAQLPQRENGQWIMPCVSIQDRPALRWRILSDDVSRGPLPTMKYFKERICTIAAFKMNGYSPYMEHVFVSPTDRLPAPLDGITPAQLHELAIYARHFHVALIPEQQTFAHMHNTLRLEQYAGMAELPHGFLLAPNVSASLTYVRRLIEQELAAAPNPPFFHIGSDETTTLGEGETQAYVAQHGRSQVYADHIVAVNRIVHNVAPKTRIMLWDDGIENDPNIMGLLPRSAVIINWHYGVQTSFLPYIHRIARGGFDQMVAPGASNWNEIYPDINTALANENLFITQGKAAHVLGVFQTVWHDDGESLFEATWYPVLYAASSAWEQQSVSPARFQADFPYAFFGSDDPRYGSDIAKLADALTRLEKPSPYDATNHLFWTSVTDDFVAQNMAKVDLHTVRLESEEVEAHLARARPRLHANAAAVMFIAARKFNLIGRKFQIMQEIADVYYADAQRRNSNTKPGDPPDQHIIRDLMWSKYWFWELRDAYEELAPLYADAWRYENRESHLESNLERYHLMAQAAIRDADAMYRVLYEDYLPKREIPPLE